MTDRHLWEILVPTTIVQDGRVIKLKSQHHFKWDEVVRQKSQGQTILRTAIGYWHDKTKLIKEDMIPVRIMATPYEMEEIADFTLKYYHQKSVMYYEISSNVHFKMSKRPENFE